MCEKNHKIHVRPRCRVAWTRLRPTGRTVNRLATIDGYHRSLACVNTFLKIPMHKKQSWYLCLRVKKKSSYSRPRYCLASAHMHVTLPKEYSCAQTVPFVATIDPIRV
jgi:hypothetical protein